MPILFFDIDGCLHPHDRAVLDHGRQKVRRSPSDGLFVWCAPIDQLLLEQPSLDLVCHSTWRKYYDLDELRRELPSSLAQRTVALTPLYPDRDISINAYIADRGLKLNNYVILDDDPWAFPIGTANLVIVKSETGLSTPQAQEDLHRAVTAMFEPVSQPQVTGGVKKPRF